MLPHRSLMANIEYAIRNMQLDAGDRMLSILPLAHAYGCAFELLWPLCVGTHITFLGRSAGPSVLLEAFKVVKPHLLLLVPLLIEKIYKKQVLPKISTTGMKIALHTPILSGIICKKIRESLAASFGDSFREVVIGGAALNPEVEAFLHKIKFHYSVGYGMTECGPLVSYAGWRSARMGSCGKLVDALEMTIDSPDPEKQAGEIMVRGEGAMLGYSDDCVRLEINAHLAQSVDFGINHAVWQTELGNAVFQHAAYLVKCLKHSHIVAQLNRSCW